MARQEDWIYVDDYFYFPKSQEAELEHRSILQEINSNFTDDTLIRFDTPISTISTIQVPSPLIPPLSSPMAPPLSSRGPVMIPVGETKDLSPPALSLLKSLWAKIGYEGSAFSGMQVEISKELSRADFARFERQMLCNEILSLRQDVSFTQVFVVSSLNHLS